STALSRSDLRALADIAEECDGHVLVDETFRELAFENRPPSAAEFGPRMIALSTVTKVCGLGTLRVGWIVGAPDLLERLAGLKDHFRLGLGKETRDLRMGLTNLRRLLRALS